MAESEPTPDKVTSADTIEKQKSRNRYKRKKGKGEQKLSPQQQASSYHKEKFTGRCDELSGFIFDVTNSKGGLGYTTASEEIARYIGLKNNSVGSYIRTAILNLQIPSSTRPTAVTTQDPIDIEMFKEEVRIYVKTNQAIKLAMKSLYDLVWGQCSETMRSRLRSIHGYETITSDADSISLLKAIRAEMTGFKEK